MHNSKDKNIYFQEGALSPAFQLQYVSVPIVDNAECAVNYLGYGEITERMMCAGYKVGQKDACQVRSNALILK